jgi:hypothetical protein
MATDQFIGAMARSIKSLVEKHGLDEKGRNSFSPSEIDFDRPMQVGRVARQYRSVLNRDLERHGLKCVDVYKSLNRTFLRIERIA